jgi:hypothetical protein
MADMPAGCTPAAGLSPGRVPFIYGLIFSAHACMFNTGEYFAKYK